MFIPVGSTVAFTASVCLYHILGSYGHARSQGGHQWRAVFFLHFFVFFWVVGFHNRAPLLSDLIYPVLYCYFIPGMYLYTQNAPAALPGALDRCCCCRSCCCASWSAGWQKLLLFIKSDPIQSFILFNQIQYVPLMCVLLGSTVALAASICI